MKSILGIAEKLSSKRYLGKVQEVTPLPHDVSPRRYFRVSYVGGDYKTAILMQLAEGDGPLGGGPRKLTQSDAFVEVQRYLARHSIRTPSIFHDARADGYLLLEDLGEISLWRALSRIHEHGFDPLFPEALKEFDELLRLAVELLQRIQQLPFEERVVVYERKPAFEDLRRGPEEFREHILDGLGLGAERLEVFADFADALSEEILAHPKVVSHYDFTSHNILVPQDRALALIDFQDACLESPARDLHALCCDRGMDELLGKERLATVLSSFFSSRSDPLVFRQQYFEYALHWDMRVSGRFTKLVKVDGREVYGQWIDGTLARVIRGLPRITKRFERAGDLLEILLKALPGAKEMLQDEWPLPSA